MTVTPVDNSQPQIPQPPITERPIALTLPSAGSPHVLPHQRVRNQLTDALFDVVESLASDSGMAKALLTATDRACEMFDVNRASIFLRSPRGAGFRGVVAQSPGDSSLVRRLRCGPSTDRMSQQIIDECAPVLVRDPVRDGRPARSTMMELNVKEVLGLPMACHDQVRGLMFLDRVGRYREFTAEDADVATHFAAMVAAVIPGARRIDDLLVQITELQRRIRHDDRLLAATERLTTMAATGATPQQIVDLTAELTGHPCVLTDGRRRLVLTDTVHAEPACLPGLPHALTQLNADCGTAQTCTVGTTTVMSCTVTADGAPRGHLTLVPHRRLSGADARVLTAAAAALSTELRIAAARSQGAVDHRRRLAQALVEGQLDDETQRLAAHLGVPLDRTRLVAVVERREASTIELDTNDLQEAFDSLVGVGAVLAAPTAGDDGRQAVTVILDVADLELLRPARLRHVATETLKRADSEELVAAFGSPAQTAAGIRAAAESAQRTMRVLRTLCPPDVACLTVDDLSFAAPLLYGIDRAGAALHVQRVLGQQADSAHGATAEAPTELLDTVTSFFANDRSIRGTSRALDVHENTVRYRLKKFHTVAGLDVLGDAQDQLTCQLALLIDRLLSGRLDPAGIAAPVPTTSEAS